MNSDQQTERTTHQEMVNRRMDITLTVGPALISYVIAMFASIDGNGYAAAALVMAGSAWAVSQFQEMDDSHD